MIKEILSVFKKDSLMERAFQRSFEMLDITLDMFLKSKKSLRETAETGIDFNIYDQDSAVNKYQREVRKDVFSHLALTGVENLPSGLVLVSIVIDIERIGDYTKNIVEISLNYKEKLFAHSFEERLLKIENSVTENFSGTINCFKNADENLAAELVGKYKWISQESDDILMALIREEDKNLGSGSAVALSLYIRSLKRINSHLRNIASGVVNPFHRIGYKVKKK